MGLALKGLSVTNKTLVNNNNFLIIFMIVISNIKILTRLVILKKTGPVINDNTIT